MWSIVLAIIALFPIINLLATILHWCKLINDNHILVNFSIAKNIREFIPKRHRADKSKELAKNFKNPSQLFDYRSGISIFFLFNGIASGNLFYRQITKNKSLSVFKQITRFYLERFLSIGPIFYLFFFSFIYYIRFIAISEHNLSHICSDSIFPSLFFYWNFYHGDDPVCHSKFEFKI